LSSPDISVVVCTYNRAALLKLALRSLFSQRAAGVSFEILVIDNNSTDDTPAVVASLVSESPVQLSHIPERQQGNAYARNAGVRNARAPIVAFIDDDVVADENWLRVMKSAFDRKPQLSFVGGRVLPVWESEPPSWLTASHWAPLALLDYGNDQLKISGKTPRGLLTANIGFRRELFEKVSGFSTALQRVKGAIGSMEDTEFLMRVCRSGNEGMYVPELITRAYIDPERLTKNYHRRWHTGHGHFYGVMNDPEFERSSFRLFGVPSHLYKQAAADALQWGSKRLSGNSDAAFEIECRLRFFHGFFRQRRRS
jgi:glycosyltransferase involved in cell wall biosynthesis